MPPFPLRRVLAAAAAPAALATLAALGGCQYLPSLPSLPRNWTADRLLDPLTPYKVEVVQGNIVTREQAAAIQPGMSRSQTRDILGSPLIADPFHAPRWDYVFTIRRQGAPFQERRVVVWFDGESVKSIDTGGDLPGERDFVASIDTFKTPATLPPLEMTPEQWRALPPPPAASAASAPEPVGPTRPYPPLDAGS